MAHRGYDSESLFRFRNKKSVAKRSQGNLLVGTEQT